MCANREPLSLRRYDFSLEHKLFVWSLETFVNTDISLSVIWGCGVVQAINPGLQVFKARVWRMVPGHPKD